MTRTRSLLFALFLLAATFALRGPFLQRATWNLDEGITITAAEQICAGGVLYRDAADHRNPLVPYLKAALLAVCGDWNTVAVHAAIAVMVALIGVGLWRLARRLGHETVGRVAALVFVPLGFLLPSGDDALAAHTEWFVLLFSTAAFLAFAAAIERPNVWRGLGVGSLFGLAFLCKQPGLLDLGVALVLLALLLSTERDRRGALSRLGFGCLTGFAAVVALTIAYFAWHGATRDLLYYAWTYNSEVYVPSIPLPRRLLTLGEPFRLALHHLPAALGLGLLGAVVLLVAAWRGLRQQPARIRLLPWLTLGWTASGIIAASLGGRAFSHYSIQALPGLSLACGWVLVESWRWCAAHGRPVRLAALAVLALATADTGRRLVTRCQEIVPRDDEWPPRFQLVADHTRPEDRIFFWGLTPDYYVYTRRLPCTRFLHTHFLTGFVVWTKLDPLLDTGDTVTPGSWAQLQEDFRRTPPAMIVDTGGVRGQVKYPLPGQPWLWAFVVRDYAELQSDRQPTGFHFYRRLKPTATRPPPAGALTDDSVRLGQGCTNHYPPTATLAVDVPAGTSRVELYADNRLVRALDLATSVSRVTFFAPAAGNYRAALCRPDGIHLGPPVVVATPRVLRQHGGAAGPVLRFAGRELRPLSSHTPHGAPTLRDAQTDTWNVPASTRLFYARPPGLQAFTFTFGLDESAYFDCAAHPASDGADVVVSFVAPDGRKSRLFARRLEPKDNGADQGPQTVTVTLPEPGPGGIELELLPGKNNDEAVDFTYLGPLVGTGIQAGPPIVAAGRHLPPEEVSANHAPVMTCDPEGKWIAHSPSSISYELPPSLHALSFSYGLEPASYDGSQGGRTDGIDITVTAEQADGSTATLFQRTLDPANVAADRGRQTSRIDLSGTSARLVTLAIGPGPNDNLSYDWSYLVDLHAESAAPFDAPAP